MGTTDAWLLGGQGQSQTVQLKVAGVAGGHAQHAKATTPKLQMGLTMKGWLQGWLTGTLLGVRSIPSLPLSVEHTLDLLGLRLEK